MFLNQGISTVPGKAGEALRAVQGQPGSSFYTFYHKTKFYNTNVDTQAQAF